MLNKKNIFRFLAYTIKEFLGVVFLVFGGVYIIKYLNKNKTLLLVLNYHNFSRYNNYKIIRGAIQENGFTENFENQIQFLKKHFNFCYPYEFFNEDPKSGINILVTFDDGYKDNYDLAFPILNKYKVKCIFFITSSYINTKNWLLHDKVRLLVSLNKLDETIAEKELKQMNKGIKLTPKFINQVNSKIRELVLPRIMMDWKELKEINDSGFKIGSHTCTHAILKFLNIKEQSNEMNKSISKIKEELSIEADCFAYPNGLYAPETNEILIDHNINYAFTTQGGCNFKLQDRLKIKRIGINASDSIPVLLLKMLMNINL